MVTFHPRLDFIHSTRLSSQFLSFPVQVPSPPLANSIWFEQNQIQETVVVKIIGAQKIYQVSPRGMFFCKFPALCISTNNSFVWIRERLEMGVQVNVPTRNRIHEIILFEVQSSLVVCPHTLIIPGSPSHKKRQLLTRHWNNSLTFCTFCTAAQRFSNNNKLII